ncbi:protein ovarian tumor locus isoform X2 [Eurosta solidaginis]|uniref:protein ovarian tumor locus isoform X2 n=1 Tax=Eurosta solidaginis TaxID=178769 RepID=UPI003530BD7B
MQRQFTSGSRQAPDPFDQFLEENNFYRKHTARDASCLFRVISEQMYDTQLHHLAIRKKCVRYMRKHRDFFAPLIERDLDDYLDDMSKPKTYGTLIELQAVGYMFQRNVLLFEPFNLGNFFSTRSYFNDVFRVFYTPERHFDSVFTCDYIKDAAICQAICYEILYKDLYKLPDVAFAVEHMLHSPTLESSEYTSENNENGYCTRMQLADGRSFKFDLPQDTNCILENYELCHFHYTNFPRLSDDLQREMKIRTNCDDYEKSALCKTAESLLPHKYISCVRQLLQEGITPFPYKVAKALDPNMYRNIEFDAWNEQRKEQKLQNWYNGDANFKVGAKCHVKLCKSGNDLYTCHIQEIAVDKGYCVVFIEQLGEKRLVPYESLTPLPPDQFKPWTLPYRFQRHMQKYSSVRLTRHYNYRFKLNGQFSNAQDYCSPMISNGKSTEYLTDITDDDIDKNEKQHYITTSAAAAQHRNGCYYKLKQYTHFENFRAHTVEYCAMPLTVEHAQRDLETKSGSVRTSTPSNENNNSNAASRTTAPEMRIKTEPNGQQRMCGGSGGSAGSLPEELMGNYNTIEHTAAGMGAPAFILPDFHYIYPAPPQYGVMPEECYSYGYDPAAMHPPAAALMPAGYYMYPPPCAPPTAFAPAPNNIYMQTAPSLPPPLITATAPHPVASHLAGGPFYSPNMPYGGLTPTANSIEVGSQQNNSPHSQMQHETPTNRNRSCTNNTNTPLTARINWDAKKSVDANGIDLPTDVATLRHFYNLGLEYHFMHLKREANARVNSGKAALKANTGNTNEDVVQEPKPDPNNNSMAHLNANTPKAPNQNTQQQSTPSAHNHLTNSGSGNNNGNVNNGSGKVGHNMHRRYPARYFNNNKDKERPVFLRNQSNNNNNNNVLMANTSTSHNLNNHPQDYNNNSSVSNNGGSGSKYTNALKANNSAQTNSNRSATPNSTHSHASQQNTKANSGSGANTNGNASSHGNYDNVTNAVGEHNTNDSGKMVKQISIPLYQTGQTNTLMTGSSYNPYGDFNGDPSMPLLPPTSAAGSIYLHMPMPPPHSFGIYAPPPPHHNVMGLHPTSTSTTCTPIAFPTPPNGGPSQHYIASPSEPVVNMALQGPPNGFYAAPAEFTNADMGGGGTTHGGDGAIQMQCLPYATGAPPPQMPFYYANGGIPMNGVAAVPHASHISGGNGCGNAGISAGPGSIGAQGYWCQPSNGLLPLPTSTPQTNGSAVCVPASNSSVTAKNTNSNTGTTRSRENK